MTERVKEKEIFNGTNGTLWITTEKEELKLGAAQSFTLKQKNNWEDYNNPNEYGKNRKFLGYELSGTITKLKIDNKMTNVFTDYANGEVPEISLIAKVENPSTGKLQRVKISEVTFDEMDIIAFEPKTMTKEEIPFEAATYKWIDNV